MEANELAATLQLFSDDAQQWAGRGKTFTLELAKQSIEVQQIYLERNRQLRDVMLVASDCNSPKYKQLINSNIMNLEYLQKYTDGVAWATTEYQKLLKEHPGMGSSLMTVYGLIIVGLQSVYMTGENMDTILGILTS